jgi:hypothetical protein
MSCPVADGCYRVVHEYCFAPNRRVLFEDLESDWKALGARIKADEPKVTTKRLRGFFCIETMYHLVFPSLQLPTELVGLRETFVTARFERDHAGLGKVINICQSTYRGITVAQGEMHLSDKPNNMLAQVSKLMAAPRAVSNSCERAARLLRPMLRGSVRGIGVVGRCFGDALQAGDVQPDTTMRYLNNMLDVSVHNPVSPWSMKNPQA